jgi:cobalt/nickel transport system permease protein
MHVHEAILAGSPEGVLVLCAGGAATAVGTLLGLRKMDYERVPRVAMLSAAFFVVSAVQLQLGPTSVHLVLAGLIGLHGTADTTLNIWMSRFLESRSFHAQPFAPGLVLSGFALSYLLSRAVLATMPDHFGRRAMMVLPGLVGGSIALGGILSRSYVLTAGGYVLGAFCWSAEYPTMVSAILRHDRRRFGAAMAVAGLASC